MNLARDKYLYFAPRKQSRNFGTSEARPAIFTTARKFIQIACAQNSRRSWRTVCLPFSRNSPRRQRRDRRARSRSRRQEDNRADRSARWTVFASPPPPSGEREERSIFFNINQTRPRPLNCRLPRCREGQREGGSGARSFPRGRARPVAKRRASVFRAEGRRTTPTRQRGDEG